MAGKEIRAQIDTENVRGLLKINGGGVVVLLAFLPTILNNSVYGYLVMAVIWSLFFLSLGLITALIHNYLRRRCSHAYDCSRPKHKFFGLGLPEPWVCHFSHLFMFASYGLFLTAVIVVFCGAFKVFNPSQQKSVKHTSALINTKSDRSINVSESTKYV